MRLVYTQLLAAGIGLLGVVILSKVDYHTIAKLWKLHVPLAHTLVLMTFLFGTRRDGWMTRAWLPILYRRDYPALRVFRRSTLLWPLPSICQRCRTKSTTQRCWPLWWPMGGPITAGDAQGTTARTFGLSW